MDQQALKNNAEKIIALVECANKIERLLQTKEINGAAALKSDHNTYLALGKLAHTAYETVLGCTVFDSTFHEQSRIRRTQFSHLKERLTKPSMMGKDGIDTITEEDFWQTDLSPQGHLSKIIPAIDAVLKSDPAIAIEVDKQRKEKGKPPITTVLTQTDFTHAKIINQIASALENGIICLIGLLKLLEDNTPSKKELFEATTKLVILSQDQFDFAVAQLESQNLIRHSVNRNYLLITNEKFCKNTMIDFLEKYGAATIIEKLGGAA